MDSSTVQDETTVTDGIEVEADNTDSITIDSASSKREKSGIVFAYDDLERAVEIAKIAHEHYGGSCGMDQLAAQLHQKTTSGAFRLKISAARIFGLITTTSQRIHVTDLGTRAIDARTAAAARSDAFLRCPLYLALYERFRNRTLPSDGGLEMAIRELGVPEKQVATARQVFQRSAEYAGFFAHGRDRLVLPPGANQDDASESSAAPPQETQRSAERQEESAIMKHPLIQGLLAVLPEPGEVFDPQQKELWLRTLDMNLSFIYRSSSTVAHEAAHVAVQAAVQPDPSVTHREPSRA